MIYLYRIPYEECGIFIAVCKGLNQWVEAATDGYAENKYRKDDYHGQA